MLTKFFAQDNATAKLSTTLILISSILTVLAQSIPSPELRKWLLIVIGVIGVAVPFFAQNKVFTRTSWLLLAYGVVNYLTTAQGLEGSVVLLSLAGALKVLAEYSTVNTPPAGSVSSPPVTPTTPESAN